MNQHFLNLKEQVEALAEKVEGLIMETPVASTESLEAELSTLHGRVLLVEGSHIKTKENIAIEKLHLEGMATMVMSFGKMLKEFDGRLKALEAKPTTKKK